MTNELTPHDWQEISVYLDHKLSPQAQARLEQRLQGEPALRSALEELGSIRSLLRSQPHLRAPRNFTLTPEMAGVRQKTAAYPILKFTAALASLLFIVIVVGDLIGQRRAPLAQPLLIQSAVQMEAAPAEAPEGPAAFSKIAPSADTAAPPAALAETPPAAAESALAPAPMGGTIQDTQTPGLEGQLPGSEATAASFQPFQLEEAPIAEEASPDLSVQEQAREESTTYPKNLGQTQVFGIDQRIWRGVEVLLGLIAVAAGLAWWITRRRS